MSDIGAIGIPANSLQEITELTPDDMLMVVNAPAGNWSLAVISQDNARGSLGGGGGGSGVIDGGNASSTYNEGDTIDCGGA